MSATIKLSSDLINEARRYGEVYSRSVPKQIEYWSRIGKIVEENPSLPYNFIKDILLALQDVKDMQTSSYNFD